MGQVRIQGRLPADRVTSTTIGATECLDVNIMGGGAVGPTYLDDANDFTLGADYGNAIMAVFTTDPVDLGDIGVLSMTADRRLRVDATMGALTINSEYVDDAGFTVASDYGLAVGGVYTTDQVNANDYGVFSMTDYREQRVAVSTGGVIATVMQAWVSVQEDEGTTALAVAATNYGYYGGGIAGQRLRPFLIDIDDNSIENDQDPQLVINENYIYDVDDGVWRRQIGDGGIAEVNIDNIEGPFTVRSPLNTGFKSFDHPDVEVNRLVWQDPPYKDGRKNDEIPVGPCKWQIPLVANTFSSYTTGAALNNGSHGPYEGAYCINLYENSGGGLGCSKLPYFSVAAPFDMRPGHYDDKVLVLEGRCYCHDSYDPDSIYTFGFFIYDGANRQCFMIEVHQVAGVWGVFRCTADNASAVVSSPIIWAENGWNYWQLEIYPPNYNGGQGFKSVTINGVQYAMGGLAGYAVAALMHFGNMDIEVGTFLTAEPERNDALWDEITCWTYYEKYIE